jgi:hypothetical protein
VQQQQQQRAYDEKEEIEAKGTGCVSREILIKELEHTFRNLETVKQQTMDSDPECGMKHTSPRGP